MASCRKSKIAINRLQDARKGFEQFRLLIECVTVSQKWKKREMGVLGWLSMWLRNDCVITYDALEVSSANAHVKTGTFKRQQQLVVLFCFWTTRLRWWPNEVFIISTKLLVNVALLSFGCLQPARPPVRATGLRGAVPREKEKEVFWYYDIMILWYYDIMISWY